MQWLALAGVATNVCAQSAGSENELEEIVVTAEKRPTDLQKTPISIQVYKGDELRKEGKKRIDEIMQGVAGVNSQDNGNGTAFYMRGVDAGTVVVGAPPGSSGQSQSAVAILIDGVYQNRSETVKAGTLDVSQVEVSRGTQSTNLGASALSGAISLVSNQPVFNYQATGTAERGNYNDRSIEGVFNLPLSDDQALRLAYSNAKRDGYVASNAGNSDNENTRLKYRWKPSDALNIVLTAQQSVSGGNGVSSGGLLYTGHWINYTAAAAADCSSTTCLGNTSPGSSTFKPTVIGYPPQYLAVKDGVTFRDRSDPWDDGFPAGGWANDPYRRATIDQYSADIDYNTGFGTFTVTPSYQTTTNASESAASGTGFSRGTGWQHTAQIDARLASLADSKLSWLAGVYYYDTNSGGESAQIQYPGASGGGGVSGACSATDNVLCYTWQNTAYNKQSTASAYGNFSYPVLDTLRAVGGVRYSKDKKSFLYSGNASGDGGGPTNAYCYVWNASTCSTASTASGSWHGLTYSAGLEYDVLPTAMAYAKYSTGYQPGNINFNTTNGQQSTIDPQTLQQWTLGLKSRFLDNRLQLNLEAFRSVYHNRVLQGGVSVSSGGPCTGAVANTEFQVDTDLSCFGIGRNFQVVVPQLFSRGVDLDANWLPTSADRLDLSAEFLESRQKRPDVPTFSTADILGFANISDPTDAQTEAAAALASQVNSIVASYDGLTLQNSPKWTLNGTYQHAFTFGDGSQLTPQLNWVYRTRYWSTTSVDSTTNVANPSVSYQNAYNLVNAYLGWQNKDGKLNVNLFVKNVGNYAVMTTYAGTYVSLDAPRTFGLTVSASL
ncbi:MAG: TonB-dependent receptor [Steroidobacteraceae bacterium]